MLNLFDIDKHGLKKFFIYIIDYLAWKTKKFNLPLKKLIDHLSQIRIALVMDKTSNKSDMIVEEMTSIQASLFSFLDMGKYIDVSSKQVQ